MSSSSHLSWKSPDPEHALPVALAKLGCRIKELPSQAWDPATATIGGVRDIEVCTFAPVPNDLSYLLLHLYSQLGEPLANELSRSAEGPVVVFHEFDQAAWGFAVFEGGRRSARYCNRPEIVEEDPATCAVKPGSLARRFGVDSKTLAPYLRHLAIEGDDPGKAFPDDEFSLGSHWVRCDFMRRLGMRYPDPAEPGTRHVYVRERGVNDGVKLTGAEP